MTSITQALAEEMIKRVEALSVKKPPQISVATVSKKGRPDLKKEQEKLHYAHVEGTKSPKTVQYSTDGTVKVYIKPLSVNTAWKGRRSKTDAYKAYTKELTWMLPDIEIPSAPYEVYYTFGFSNEASDWDNPIKPMQDIIAARYKFNDKLIKKAHIEIITVDKGNEFIQFKIESLL